MIAELRPVALLIATGMVIASAANPDSELLLQRVRAKVQQDIVQVPRYACRQELEFQLFTPVKRLGACEALPGQFFAAPPRVTLQSSERAGLDVMLAADRELCSWPGQHAFNTENPGDLLGPGLSGSGDFASFLIDIFNLDQVSIKYMGPCDIGNCVQYRYAVPVLVSRFAVKAAPGQVTVGYHGIFSVNPETADMESLTVIPDNLRQSLPDTCETRLKVNYTRIEMHNREITIPGSTAREFLAANGAYSRTRSLYQGCREYEAESSLSFEDNLPAAASKTAASSSGVPPLPGHSLQLRLLSTIDSESSAAGDGVEAILVHPVAAVDGHTIDAGTVFQGHIARLQAVFFPRRHVNLSLLFDTMISSRGPVPVSLDPHGVTDTNGRAMFTFAGSRIVLDRHFVSQWRTRQPAATKLPN